MKFWFFGIVGAVFIFTTSCKKEKNESKLNSEDLPASVRPHLSSSCSEGCMAYVQLVEYNGQQYYYLGLQAQLCDPDPNNMWTEYYDLRGNPIGNNSDLATQIRSEGTLTDDVWNCLP